MDGVLSNIFRHRELLWILVGRNLKIRYKHSVLGFFWTLLGPLCLILIYALFLGVMRFEIRLPVLVTGIIVWQFLGMCLGDSLHAIVGNANLVTKAAFPRLILPLAMVLSNLINFLLSAAVLVVYLVIVRVSFGAVYWLPLIVLTQFALCLGTALILASANVFFRDTEHMLSIIMLAWFFLTPIIYPIQKVYERFPGTPAMIRLFFANPMTGLVTAYRAVFL
ncbi:MAG: ABC transporter permease, partial [Sedimentisphaerales bacterium]|nr:ABC transporter permease [Sedimentisphaerales bacterium]